MPRTHLAGLALLLTALAPSLTGQWSSDAAVNLAVGDSASDQSQAKLAAPSE